MDSMASLNSLQDAFEKAKRTFRDKLKDKELYEEITTNATITDVYKATAKIQEEAAGKARLRNLAKIRPYLDRLASYAATIEVFVQVKPDLLALVWGPIKLILLWSSQIAAALDKIADAMAKIGLVLPHFAIMAQTFEASDVVQAALVLFYEDILDFYRINLEFFRKPRWKQMFDVIWPSHGQKLNVIVGNLEKHSHLMREEVTILDIKEAREARQQSLQHFEKVYTFQELQKFMGLKSRVSATLHEEQLDKLRNRSMTDAAKWLLQDTTFSRWFDIANRSIACFWLQGIPGAGKTFVCASVIDYAKRKHRCLFAFVSYAEKTGLTARSVIHSLIFQAAEDDEDFRALLVDSKESELRGSTGHAAGLLRSFLKTAGQTYIIIDGLDEMEECERQTLLQKLDEISKECGDLKMLISSRAVDDIYRMLEQKARTIRLQDRNAGSIQAYVNHRSQEWMARRQFAPTIKSEMLGLLAPVSANAKGMFLYARIVLDILEKMGIQQIRSELKAPPNDLTDAYHRIFQRINDSKPHMREKCRKALGWIGCAPVPLTALELEQALLVDTDPRKTDREAPYTFTNLNLVEMCGPIIEVIDEKLQFVHFTVQEYIFSEEINNYIDKFQANEDLLKTFLAYLGSSALLLEVDDQDIDDNILAGRYRLFEYASFYWPRLLQMMDSTHGNSWGLNRLLNNVVQRTRNYDFDYDADNLQALYKNRNMREKEPEAYEMVCATFQFYLDNQRWDWTWDNSELWVNLDPLTTSKMLARIQKQYEALLSDSESVALVRHHYGSHLFKCTYPFCLRSRRGFKTKEGPQGREAHIKLHGKPWKCSVLTCDFSAIGFSSKRRRDDHWSGVHLPTTNQLHATSWDFDSLDMQEAQPLLFSFVENDDVDSVSSLLSSSSTRKLKAEVIASARQLAAKQGSFALTKLLAPENETVAPFSIAKAAIQSEDPDFVKWLLSLTDPHECATLMVVMLGAATEEIYELWEDHIVAMPKELKSRRERGPIKYPLDDLFKQSLFASIQHNPMKEARLKHTMRKLSGQMDRRLLGSILVRIAKSSCSVPLAKEVLELGAPINFPVGFGGGGVTALHAAAKTTTKEAALLMQLLILKGADTYSATSGSRRRKNIGTEKGATNIAQWVGLTWNELRRKYRKSLYTPDSQDSRETQGFPISADSSDTESDTEVPPRERIFDTTARVIESQPTTSLLSQSPSPFARLAEDGQLSMNLFGFSGERQSQRPPTDEFGSLVKDREQQGFKTQFGQSEDDRR